MQLLLSLARMGAPNSRSTQLHPQLHYFFNMTCTSCTCTHLPWNCCNCQLHKPALRHVTHHMQVVAAPVCMPTTAQHRQATQQLWPRCILSCTHAHAHVLHKLRQATKCKSFLRKNTCTPQHSTDKLRDNCGQNGPACHAHAQHSRAEPTSSGCIHLLKAVGRITTSMELAVPGLLDNSSLAEQHASLRCGPQRENNIQLGAPAPLNTCLCAWLVLQNPPGSPVPLQHYWLLHGRRNGTSKCSS